jgi:hypothetical protein
MRCTSMTLRFVLTLGAFFSCLAGASAATSVTFGPVDIQSSGTPSQIFVRDNGARAETDERGSVHIAGLRGPQNEDAPDSEVYNAEGSRLLFTIEKWRAAGGTADVSADGGGDKITLSLHRLIAFGHYSVFIRTNGNDGVRFAPIDGSGIGNDFDAKQDGAANIVVSSPEHLASGCSIVIIYHSDDQDHGNFPGMFARTAHQHLIARIP